jgi:hypothetical protein
VSQFTFACCCSQKLALLLHWLPSAMDFLKAQKQQLLLVKNDCEKEVSVQRETLKSASVHIAQMSLLHAESKLWVLSIFSLVHAESHTNNTTDQCLDLHRTPGEATND